MTALGSVSIASDAASPFRSCTLGGPGTVTTNSEVEPSLALDPTRDGRILVAWQQDRWSNGAARGIVAATEGSSFGSWLRNEPAFSACAPGGERLPTRVSDPWLSVGPDGIAYLTGLSVTQPNETWVTVSRSADGGRTWSAPGAVATSSSARAFNDKESVTADPRRPGRAWIVWDQSGGGESESGGNGATRGTIMLSATADAGRTWSPARVIASVAGTPVGNEIVVLADGTLVDAFVLAPTSARDPAVEMALRSTDGGATWSAPIAIDTLAGHDVVGSQPPGVRGGGGLPDLAVDAKSGSIVAVWADRPGGSAEVVVSSSADGRTWTPPSRVPRPTGPVFTPSVAVTPDGTIGVEYTDLRAATAASPFLADRFLATSTDGGTTWRERRLTETFDLAGAPNAGGRFLGDYSGLAADGSRFVSSFAVTTGNDADPTSLLVRSDPAVDPLATQLR